MKRTPALVKPALLVWARETMQLSRDEAAERLDVPLADLEAWESGTSSPYLGTVKRMAKLYHRPLALFYLPHPPAAEPVQAKFRTVAGKPALLGREVILVLRDADRRRRTCLRLTKELEEDIPTFSDTVKLSDAPQEVAKHIRMSLGADLELQLGPQTKTPKPFDYWRSLLEAKGVLVFQFSGIDVEVARGLSLFYSELPVILVNSKDEVRGRCFTLLHEYCHLLLGADRLCSMDDYSSKSSKKVEVFCNAVAGYALVPSEPLMKLVNEYLSPPNVMLLDGAVRKLASKFKVSEEVIWRRLLTENAIDQERYSAERTKLLARLKKSKKKDEDGSQPNYYAMRSQQLGNLFQSIAFSAHAAGNLTLYELSQALGVPFRGVEKLEQRLYQRI